MNRIVKSKGRTFHFSTFSKSPFCRLFLRAILCESDVGQPNDGFSKWWPKGGPLTGIQNIMILVVTGLLGAVVSHQNKRFWFGFSSRF